MKFLKKKDPNKLCSSSVGRKTCPKGGQWSTGALKERQSPPKKGAPGLSKLHLGPQRRAIGTSIQIGDLAQASCSGLLSESKQNQFLTLKIENQTFNPGQAGVKPDNL